MESYEVELHALACEIADVEGLDYDEALARARCELGTVQHYVDAWDQCAAYLEVLVLLKRGEYPPAALLNAFISDD